MLPDVPSTTTITEAIHLVDICVGAEILSVRISPHVIELSHGAKVWKTLLRSEWREASEVLAQPHLYLGVVMALSSMSEDDTGTFDEDDCAYLRQAADVLWRLIPPSERSFVRRLVRKEGQQVRRERMRGDNSIVLVARPRGEGKTTALLDWMRAAPKGEHRVAVSPTREQSRLLQRNGRELGLESWQFVGVSEVKPGCWGAVLRGRGGRIVLGFDDADTLLQNIAGNFRVGMATFSVGPR